MLTLIRVLLNSKSRNICHIHSGADCFMLLSNALRYLGGCLKVYTYTLRRKLTCKYEKGKTLTKDLQAFPDKMRAV